MVFRLTYMEVIGKTRMIRQGKVLIKKNFRDKI